MASRRVREALGDTPVVMIVGPRQCGKSTLSREFESGRQYITLDDPATLAHAKENPRDFLLAYPAPIIIDEIQRAPELFLPLKLMVDQKRIPGSYLLTGSANVLLLPKVADSLAGRMEVIDLRPLGQFESEEAPSNWIDQIFAEDRPAFRSSKSLSLEERITRGGYPEPFHRAAKRREPWFQSYLRTLLDRDVRDLANIDGLSSLPKLLRLLASRAGAPLNLSNLARETNLPYTTITRYVDLLKALYLIQTVPAWSADLEVRLARTPKVYLVDTGLACYLNSIEESQLRKPSDLRFSLLETFVANELQKLIDNAEGSYELFHLRTIKNKEVSFLIESRDGRIVAIDLRDEKAAYEGSSERIEYVREITGEQFYRGVWLHTGEEIKPLASDIYSMPVSALWS
jgi:predicted AAA+ superfamily ATPase